MPEKLFDPDLTTYIYQDEVVVLVPLTVAASVKPGTKEIRAKVSWLECAAQCLPGQAEVQTTLTIGSQPKPSRDAALIAAWEKKLPKDGAGLEAKAWWEKPPAGAVRPVILEWNSRANRQGADFYPDASDDFELQGQVEQAPSAAGKIAIRKEVKKLSGDWPKRLSGLLVEGAGAARAAYQVSLEVKSGQNAPALENSAPRTTDGVPAASGLWKNLIYAFVGGLILNIMPCVLPGDRLENPGIRRTGQRSSAACPYSGPGLRRRRAGFVPGARRLGAGDQSGGTPSRLGHPVQQSLFPGGDDDAGNPDCLKPVWRV